MGAATHLSYDAWGKQRNADGSDATTCITTATTLTRGFTNQEQTPAACLVNLNARLYDAAIGRFLSADPMVGDPMAANAFNRYAYVLNNPLSFTDPSGLCFLGCFWNSPIFRDVLGIGLAIIFQQWGILPSLLGESTAFAGSAVGIIVNGAIVGGITGALPRYKAGGTLFEKVNWKIGRGARCLAPTRAAARPSVAPGPLSALGARKRTLVRPRGVEPLLQD